MLFLLTVRNTVSSEFGLCQSVCNMCIVSVMYLDVFDLWAVALFVTFQLEPVISDRAAGRG